METYGMPAPDDPAIDVYQQYISQTDYRCERPEDGDHMRMSPLCCDEFRQQFAGRSNNYRDDYSSSRSYHNDSASAYGGSSYRLNSRQCFENRRMNSRNGLYSPDELRGGGGDYSNSLPGLGNYERPMSRHVRRHRWF